MMETCGSCGGDYSLTSDNAGVVVYLGYLAASHVWATCTHCRARETIYCAPRTLAALTKDQHFGVVIETEPSRQRREAADVAWAKHREPASDEGPMPEPACDLPDLPREWIRQLHDDLRAFGAGTR